MIMMAKPAIPSAPGSGSTSTPGKNSIMFPPRFWELAVLGVITVRVPRAQAIVTVAVDFGYPQPEPFCLLVVYCPLLPRVSHGRAVELQFTVDGFNSEASGRCVFVGHASS